jgi:hypothetical protein
MVAKIWLVTHMDLHRTAKVQSFVRHLKSEVMTWPVDDPGASDATPSTVRREAPPDAPTGARREAGRGHLAMLAFSALIAGSFSLGGQIANDIDPAALNAVRFTIAAVAVYAVLSPGRASARGARCAVAIPPARRPLRGLFRDDVRGAEDRAPGLGLGGVHADAGDERGVRLVLLRQGVSAASRWRWPSGRRGRSG